MNRKTGRFGPAARGLLLALALAAWANGGEASDLGRLATPVRPMGEDVALELDPRQPNYSGTVTIALEVPAPTNSFALHAEEMQLGSIELIGVSDGSKPIVLTAKSGEHGLLTLTAPATIAKGLYRLTIPFSNDYNTQATSLYRLKQDEDWYCFTQFEADDAREAFPCFDEPEFKIPWNVTITSPEKDVVIGNTKVDRETIANGRKTTVFTTTKPLPSYLVAIATGPLETVPIDGLGVPGRVVCVKGASALTAEAVRVTPMLVAALESYFGRPYPYDKLDLLAVPEFWPGAMENAGAITFADRVLLLDSQRASPTQKRTLASFTAHELSHMWFGDLVTMRWWDDLWLNESFASWMGEKVTHQVFPEMGIDLREVSDAHEALSTDGTLTTRAIRQPVTSLANLLQSADVLAYKKGQTVLGMFEQWAGEAKFRQGVRDYMGAHAWGNATAQDLWNALSKAAAVDVSGAMATFLDQPGMPLISLEPLPGGKLKLSQERFLPAGAPKQKPQTWRVPMVLRYGSGAETKTLNVLLDTPTKTVDLGVAQADWIEPNGTAWGYYRWRMPEANLTSLADRAGKVLEPRERMELVYNAKALLDAGVLHADSYLAVLPGLLRDSEPQVVGAAIDGLEEVKEPLITKDLEPAFARYVRESLSPALDRIGRLPSPGESEQVAILRPRILQTLADEGQDPSIRAFGDSLAKAYLANPTSVAPSLAATAMQIAALSNDRALHAEYRRRFESTPAPAERRMYLAGMSAFRDTAIAHDNLTYSLAGPLKPQEVFYIGGQVAQYAPNRDLSWHWLQANYDGVMKKVPPMYAAFLPAAARGCSMSRLAEAKTFFADPAHAAPGSEKEVAKLAESVEDCAKLRDREGPRVRAYLTRTSGMN